MLWPNFKWIIAALVGLMILHCAVGQEFTCIHCNDAENCFKNVSIVQEMVKCNTTCFTRLNENSTVERNCLADGQVCDSSNCISCNTENCNKNSFCKICNSNTDSQCAQTNASTAAYSLCTSTTSKCFVSVLQNITERGCTTEEFEKTCTDTKKCKLCEGFDCNVGIFPADRRTCLQCKDTTASCANSQSSSSGDSIGMPCLLYAEDDKCYMFGSDETHVTRGCISDIDENNKCANSSDAKCKICNTNECNEWAYNMDQTLTCIVCSSATNDTCAWGQAASNAKSCTNKLLYTQEDKCYTRTDENGVVTRGCYYDMDEAAQTACTVANNCTICTNANGCNNIDGKNFTCIRCRSDNNPDCRSDANKIGGEKCSNLVTSDADASCFTGVWRDDIVIRGCLIDLEASDKLICNDPGDDNCEVCSGINCNTKANGAGYLLFSNGLLAAVLLTLCRLK